MKMQHSVGRVLVLSVVLTEFGAPAQNTNNHEHWAATRVASPRQFPSVGARSLFTCLR
jgi:hypothetical protein